MPRRIRSLGTRILGMGCGGVVLEWWIALEVMICANISADTVGDRMATVAASPLPSAIPSTRVTVTAGAYVSGDCRITSARSSFSRNVAGRSTHPTHGSPAKSDPPAGRHHLLPQPPNPSRGVSNRVGSDPSPACRQRSSHDPPNESADLPRPRASNSRPAQLVGQPERIAGLQPWLYDPRGLTRRTSCNTAKSSLLLQAPPPLLHHNCPAQLSRLTRWWRAEAARSPRTHCRGTTGRSLIGGRPRI